MQEVISSMHSHTEMSNIRFLDVCHKVEDLIDKAVELQCPCLAITDHESLSGAVRAIRYVKDNKASGKIPEDFSLAIGNEIYLVDSLEPNDQGELRASSDYYHFILIAKDEIGFRQLKVLSSIAWSQSYNTGKMTRVPTTKEQLFDVISQDKGHVLASTACLGSELGKLLILGKEQNNMTEQVEKKIYNYITYCLDLFGDDFRLEMQPGISAEQIYVNKQIKHLSEQYNIPAIITTDVHYLTKDMRGVHEAYLNSREDEQREVSDFYESTYMMECSEIHERMDSYFGSEYVSELIKNTNDWSSVVKEYDIYHDQVVPKATIPEFTLDNSFEFAYEHCPYIQKFVESDNIYDRYFIYLVIEGWWSKAYNESLDQAEIRKMMSRINDECEAIWISSERIHDKVSAYYLTALEIVNMMWDDSEDGGGSLVGPSRGSIASFYTAYLIGLQQINPLTYDIPYWRHLK